MPAPNTTKPQQPSQDAEQILAEWITAMVETGPDHLPRRSESLLRAVTRRVHGRQAA